MRYISRSILVLIALALSGQQGRYLRDDDVFKSQIARNTELLASHEQRIKALESFQSRQIDQQHDQDMKLVMITDFMENIKSTQHWIMGMLAAIFVSVIGHILYVEWPRPVKAKEEES